MAKMETMDTLTINELIPRLRRCIKIKRPVFIWSGPGVGKSSVITWLAKSLGGTNIDMRLGQMQPTDIKGIPFFNSKLNKMSWAPNEELPSKEMAEKYPVIILFLDEMNSAPPSVQAAAYQLVLDRRCGTYELPDNVAIIAAGNRDGDRGVSYRMPSPLANRFMHFEIKPDFDSWLDWALESKIHSDVVAFLTTYKSDLYDFDPNSSDRSFPTPRSWEFVSQILYTNTESDPMTDSELRSMVGACVGQGHATKYMTFLNYGKDLPKPSDILDGKVKELKTREISAHYQLIISLLYEMREFWHGNTQEMDSTGYVGQKRVQLRKWNSEDAEKKWRVWFDNFNTFILNCVELEIAIMAMRIAISNYHFSLSTEMLKLKTWPKMVQQFFPYMKEA